MSCNRPGRLPCSSQLRPQMCGVTLLLAFSLFAAVMSARPAVAQGPRVLPADQLPADRRLDPLKDLNGYFPFEPAVSPREWDKRSARLRRGLLVSLGLWPAPTKTPLNAVVHGRIDLGEYTVEKVYFESFPGFYVTGSLYRPKNAAVRRPGVLCPHGHWPQGRFYDPGEAKALKEIEQGAEELLVAARSPLQARCVQLARMGCVVFHYDMIGYADNQQISYEVSHRFAKQRPEMNSEKNWGLFSPQAEAHFQSVMGLQAYNSIRALDFITSLDDVDPDRLAVTGASGGGTQTFIIAAIDPRPAVAMPAVMVSTAMQGGCTCENCSGLRIAAGNVEFAAMFAPKPLGLTAADDWTREMTTKGFPQLQQHYRTLGAEDNVMIASNIQFAHNYNYVSRMAMYRWFNKHLKLGQAEPIQEKDFKRLTPEEMTVWDDSHPQPDAGPKLERTLLRIWNRDSQEQLVALTPKDALPGSDEVKDSLRRFDEIVGGGIDAVIGRDLPAATDVEYEQTDKIDRGDYLQIVGLLRNTPHGEELPIVFLHPKRWEGQVVIWIDPQGKSALYSKDDQPNPQVKRLLAAGASVVGVDLFYQGEFLANGKPIAQTRRVENPREAACYTFGFNHSLFARRVHDLLTVIAYVKNHELTPKTIDLVGLNGGGAWVAAARAQARDAVDRAVVDTQGFRFGQTTDIHSVNFLPGGAKYFDLPGMLAVAAPNQLWLAGEGPQGPKIVRATYRAAGASDAIATFDGKPKETSASAISWLLKNN